MGREDLERKHSHPSQLWEFLTPRCVRVRSLRASRGSAAGRGVGQNSNPTQV